jgi:hypothetical protein
MNYAALNGHGCGLGPIACAELAQYIVYMALDGCFAYGQGRGYFLITISSNDQRQDVSLAGGQAGASHSKR